MTRSLAPEAARLRSVQKILDAADLAQGAGDWKRAAQLIEMAFAALDQAANFEEDLSPIRRRFD